MKPPRSRNVLLRHLRREVYKSVSFVMLAFVGLFAFFDLIAEIDRLSLPGTSWAFYFLSVFLGMPSKIYEIAPIAALIGSIYALVQLASHSEFTAMRAAGLSTNGFVKLMGRVAVGVVAITVLFGEGVAPVAEKLAVPMRAKALGFEVERDFRSGYWLRDAYQDPEHGKRVRFVNFKDFTKEGQIRFIEYYELDDQARLRSWVRAASANFDRQGGYWMLENALRQSYFDGVVPGNQVKDGISLTVGPMEIIDRLQWRSSLTPQLLTGLFVRPDRMSAIQLHDYSRFLQSNGQATDDIDMAFAKKVIYPIAIFVMILISLSFAYLQSRSGGVSVRVFIGVMIGIGFHLVNSLFSHLSMVAKLPPFMSASIPTMVGLVVGLATLWWVSRPAPLYFLKKIRRVPDISLDS